VGLAHWACRSRCNDHDLFAVACPIKLADPAATDLLQPVPDWSAGPVRSEERVLVVPGRFLVSLRCNCLRLYSLTLSSRWGVAGAAFQIEGAAKDEGRGPSVWDALSRVTNHIVDNSTADVADNVSVSRTTREDPKEYLHTVELLPLQGRSLSPSCSRSQDLQLLAVLVTHLAFRPWASQSAGYRSLQRSDQHLYRVWC
jgi:hypothetical protein